MAKQAHTPTIEEIEAEVLAVRERMGNWQPPSNERWAELSSPHLVNVRVAYISVLQSSEKAREISEGFGREGLETVVESLMASAMYLHSLEEVLWTAAQRLAAYAPDRTDIRSA